MREKKAAVVFSNREKPAVSIESTSKVSRNSRKKHLVFGRETKKKKKTFQAAMRGVRGIRRRYE